MKIKRRIQSKEYREVERSSEHREAMKKIKRREKRGIEAVLGTLKGRGNGHVESGERQTRVIKEKMVLRLWEKRRKGGKRGMKVEIWKG